MRKSKEREWIGIVMLCCYLLKWRWRFSYDLKWWITNVNVIGLWWNVIAHGIPFALLLHRLSCSGIPATVCHTESSRPHTSRSVHSCVPASHFFFCLQQFLSVRLVILLMLLWLTPIPAFRFVPFRCHSPELTSLCSFYSVVVVLVVAVAFFIFAICFRLILDYAIL